MEARQAGRHGSQTGRQAGSQPRAWLRLRPPRPRPPHPCQSALPAAPAPAAATTLSGRCSSARPTLRCPEQVLSAPGSKVQGLAFRIQGPGSRFQGPAFRIQGQGSRVQAQGSRVQGTGFREWGSKLSVPGPGVQCSRARG
eukprot:366478-Chlamydomonas_euryale.AAC.1